MKAELNELSGAVSVLIEAFKGVEHLCVALIELEGNLVVIYGALKIGEALHIELSELLSSRELHLGGGELWGDLLKHCCE